MQHLATGGPKMPLNSWMAFCKYCNASLAPNTQKTISKVLMSWWRRDPFEVKWATDSETHKCLEALGKRGHGFDSLRKKNNPVQKDTRLALAGAK